MALDSTAPGFDPDATDLPWYRRAVAQGLGYFAPSVAFLGIPIFYAWGTEALPPLLVTLAITAALYLGTTLVMDWRHEARWLWIAGLIAAVLAIAWVSGDPAQVAYYLAYVTASAAVLLPWWESRVLIPCLAIAGIAMGSLTGNQFAALMALSGGLIGASLALGLQNGRTQAALRREEQRTAVLAVAAERERIGRDLHDILGHSLTTIAVKADLARALLDRDATRAAAEIDDLAQVARQSLADVRATASGMREVRLATEIASARSVLQAAGVECRTPSAVTVPDDAASELLGYVVREAITNVVRHADASVCTIEVARDSVVVADDGRGLGDPSAGRGLSGLAERLGEAGGTLAVESSASGTRVTATLGPGGGRVA
jgi:two-component system sensor histidine kinase DesK